MLFYIIKRVISMIPLFIGITIISFVVIHLAPGSPTDVMTDLNPKITKEARERLKEFYGLDKPLHIQYINWLKRIVRLDFGNSFSRDNRPVIDKILEALPITILINSLSLFIILIIAIPIGVYSAYRQYSLFDKITTILVFIGFAAPTFWIALLAMILFGVKLQMLPISGLKSLDYGSLSLLGMILDRTKHLILPVLISAFGGLAGISRYMRGNMLEVLREDYITTARAKGLDENSVIFKHAMRNALLPVITILGLSIPGLIGGSVIFETIFAIPGMGRLFYYSVMSRDYPVVMGILVMGSVLTLLGNLLADISYATVDPRISTEK